MTVSPTAPEQLPIKKYNLRLIIKKRIRRTLTKFTAVLKVLSSGNEVHAIFDARTP